MTDREAHALLDLLLEPLRCASDEMFRGLVEHQDGARIRLEHITNPRQELVEQFAQRKVRKCRVEHGLQPSQDIRRRGSSPEQAHAHRIVRLRNSTTLPWFS